MKRIIAGWRSLGRTLLLGGTTAWLACAAPQTPPAEPAAPASSIVAPVPAAASAPMAPGAPVPAASAPPQKKDPFRDPGNRPAVPPPGDPGQDVTAEFDLPAGLQATVWAASPQLFNPTNMDVDHRGRVWVTEGVNYRFSIRAHKPGWPIHEKGERLVILEDRDGDGAAETSKVFVEDPELTVPLGIAVFGNRVLVSASPSIVVYTDEDGDDRADKKEVFLTGFGGVDDDHGVHSISAGPDGSLYFSTGNQGPHTITDRAGFTFRKLDDDPRPDHPQSDDGRTWIQGVILRIGTDGKGLRALAHNFRNNYEVALDSFGNLFQNDNDDDGNEACRFTHVFPGGNYGYASANGRRRWYMDHREGQSKAIAHWHQEDPGVIPATEVTGAGAPGGLVVIEGGLLPASYSGMVLNADGGRRTIWGHKLTAAGAGFASKRSAFMAAKRPADGRDSRADWFRPSDVTVGPDGAIYVADWYDAMVGGHATLDSAAAGRILRIAPRGPAGKSRIPAIDVAKLGADPEAAWAVLANPAVNVRNLGWQALRAMGDKARPVLAKAAGDRRRPQARLRARALWLLAALGVTDTAAAKLVTTALGDRDPDIRLTAFRALRAASAKPESVVAEHAALLARDPSAAVRRELALSLRDIPASASLAILETLAARFDGKDRYLLEAIGIGAEGKEAALFEKLMTGATPDPLRWPAGLAALAWRLHPVAAIPGLRARALAPKLAQAERDKALVALAFINHAEAVAAVMDLALNPAHPLSALAARLAAPRAEHEWLAFGVKDRLAELNQQRNQAAADPKVTALRAELAGKGAALAPKRKEAVLRELAATASGGMFLIGEASAKRLDDASRALVAEAIFGNPDPVVRALASKHFERPSFGGLKYPAVPELLAMKGDAARGRAVFLSPTAACVSCHEMQGQGRNVGPALSVIGDKMGREALFDAILNPSAGIAFGYTPSVIMTKDGQALTGFVLAEGDTVALRDTTGETRFIPKTDITHRERQTLSLMPDNIALGMKPQELVDLVAFLSTRAVSGRAVAGKK